MSLLWRICKMVAAALALVLFVTLAVTNRHDVRLILDPFKPQDPILSINAPFFTYLLGALFVGLVLGGLASWFTQGKWRKTARQRTREAYQWKQEADRLNRERDPGTRPALPAAAGHR